MRADDTSLSEGMTAFAYHGDLEFQKPYGE
jgi:hypothetical protein